MSMITFHKMKDNSRVSIRKSAIIRVYTIEFAPWFIQCHVETTTGTYIVRETFEEAKKLLE